MLITSKQQKAKKETKMYSLNHSDSARVIPGGYHQIRSKYSDTFHWLKQWRLISAS